MRKIDVGQTVSILANIGVIAGIVFLAVELNQNNALLRNEARYNLHLGRTTEIERGVYYPEIEELWIKAVQGEPLTLVESERFGALTLGSFVRWEWYYEQFRDGLIEQDVLPIAAWVNIFSQGPIIGEMWEQQNGLLTPEFVQWMNENVVNAEQ